jgi:hypothetical protein
VGGKRSPNSGQISFSPTKQCLAYANAPVVQAVAGVASSCFLGALYFLVMNLQENNDVRSWQKHFF